MRRLPAGFCIDATEVTREQYAAWLAQNPNPSNQTGQCTGNTDFHPTPGCMSSAKCSTDCDRHPQECVDWCDAVAYCKAQNKRLCGKLGSGAVDYTAANDPLQSQWFAACSANGVNAYVYGADSVAGVCNAENAFATTTVVGSLPGCQSPTSGYEGVFDLSGNVSEWEDCCDTNAQVCRTRGGGLSTAPTSHAVECQSRDFLSFSFLHVDNETGFRCCSDPL